MHVNIVTCTDWNYRRWATTLLKSLHNQYANKYVIAVGEGDWESWGAQLGVTIVHQPFNHAMDPVRWCQNVRMRHLRALLENCDYLLQVDSDVRQNKFTNWTQFRKGKIWAYTKYWKNKNDILEPVKDRFRINAGWVLYKNGDKNRKILEKIQQQFDYEYKDEDGWDQIKLFEHYGNKVIHLNNRITFIDDGSQGGFHPDSPWFHCKGPGRKQNTNLESWHNLNMTPQLT
tara:strand:- start:51 stop:740 length:690 start_codon:yes stop_codon:yes gene_type:complete